MLDVLGGKAGFVLRLEMLKTSFSGFVLPSYDSKIIFFALIIVSRDFEIVLLDGPAVYVNLFISILNN